MFKNNKNNALLAAGLTALTYGGTYPIVKTIMPIYIKPYGLTLIRVIGATLLFWIAGLWIKKEKIAYKDFLLIFLTALSGASLNMLFLLKGLTYTSAINASIIILSTPLFVVVNSYFLLKEKIGFNRLLGIIIGLLGAAVIVLKGLSFEGFNVSLLGDLLVLGSPLIYSFYLIIMKKLVRKYHVLTITKWSLLFGVIIVLPFGLEELSQTHWEQFSIYQISALAYLVIATSFLAVLFTLFSLKYIKATTFSSFMYLQPVFTIIIVYLIGEGSVNTIQIIGMLMVITGCYLVNNKIKKI